MQKLVVFSEDIIEPTVNIKDTRFVSKSYIGIKGDRLFVADYEGRMRHYLDPSYCLNIHEFKKVYQFDSQYEARDFMFSWLKEVFYNE